MSRRIVLAAGMAAAFLGALPARLCAAEIPAQLLACTAETDDEQRLACFDRAVAQMGKSVEAATAARAATPVGQPAPAGSAAAAPAAAAAAAPPVAAAAAPPAAAAAAGATPPAVAPAAAPAAASVASAQPPAATSSSASLSPEEEFGRRAKRDRQSQQLTELTATAAAISSKPHGELVVTLDNDQVWAEIAPGKIKLKPGDTVRIEAGTLGSFILFAPNGRSSKVVRIR